MILDGKIIKASVLPLWQEPKQWAFALSNAEGQAIVRPSLQLSSIPGQHMDKRKSLLAVAKHS